MIRFNDLKPTDDLAIDLDAALHRVMRSGRYIGGLEVEAFEQEWAEYCGARYCIGCASGLEALMLSLIACGVDRNDEVIVPGWGCVQTWMAVVYIGAVPVPVWPWEPGRIAGAVTHKTRAIIPVHLYGIPSFVPSLSIEDACQAHGIEKQVWSSGLAAAYSFYPTKNLGAYGDGGAIVTNDEEMYRLITGMINHSLRRLDPLQAAFLRVKLPYLDLENQVRRANAQRYLAGLCGVILPEVSEGTNPCWHQFVIRHQRRDELRGYLAGCGIETAIHYPVPPHRALGLDYDLPAADELARTVLSLPIGPHLKAGEVDYIIEKVNEFTGINGVIGDGL